MAEDERTAASLNKLLDALVEKVTLDYGDLQAEEKYDYLLDVFENRQLKQAMEYVESPVILSTVHGAKGLEWDYVFIIDLEIWGMPGYFICKDCGNKYDKTTAAKCRFPDVSNADFKERMRDGISIDVKDDSITCGTVVLDEEIKIRISSNPVMFQDQRKKP